ncbi:uncharacterized protein SPSK_10005 [Sporothrix schenckii 1099-18]|uniref:Uncharacterized protein n=1 Tax=Sporothrix schenckii 1099-18 TaxID=1397361 RepID=A0A0F2M9R1_SPOSC|nr:uncharacterized protein SPSK_10005 [Sporothrix schenckii 1099-18]KJR85545.1 hypothetical protein SPSK_10005 [Sporothrix schenckii 1099-18]
MRKAQRRQGAKRGRARADQGVARVGSSTRRTDDRGVDNDAQDYVDLGWEREEARKEAGSRRYGDMQQGKRARGQEVKRGQGRCGGPDNGKSGTTGTNKESAIDAPLQNIASHLYVVSIS